MGSPLTHHASPLCADAQVGIGVVALRKVTSSEGSSGETEVLLVRRAKAPEVGKWTFPGGSLEVGETMVECAVREAYEETGLNLRNDPETAGAVEEREGGLSSGLEVPTPFAAADVIVYEDSGRLAFHYAIVEIMFDRWQLFQWILVLPWYLVVMWMELNLTKNSAKIAEEAAWRFAAAL
ncbi:hypothetical protein COCSUDRAFT_83657 [Coccomyxa subellipsoidea C-169]|uniref:Nudix hydrolase domain-containing protein n=1 Tax=Coccomyxa subellipsoidea (strain C-169) TaxID=574566 RepID=I0Z2U6_COCSC|nr:hypothetical protein COCSUDRAFT_83657 [Coccomyxa subellipsoidea C-169]EIE24965.1 hypothetical protein COCSUDRAFT_83657 [Coccomyxa subellipsoidea C-169]|eukprot:XP_005649509.1 hypothetical protein COCSUDRAFT_83657 [Coccomyxa subellipsoidea C-169]